MSRMKPAKYCTAPMLGALRNARLGQLVPLRLWWPLKSRGWIDWGGAITRAGVAYLIKRGYNDDLITRR